jgi:uncharacterized SAM-binding protein YcdF (DUF218 family)
MLPYLTRFFWVVAQPLSVVLVLFVAGLILLWLRRRRLAGFLLTISLLVFAISSFTTFGYWLIAPLENRFTRPPEPAHIDGIVVLGGGMDSEVNTVRHGWELTRSGDRMVETVRLALRHPEARIVVAAGPSALATDEEPEGEAARRMFAAFGIDPARVQIDDRSRNTDENAAYAKTLAGNVDGQTWLLVTSAFHMPRAVGLFRQVGFPVVPWPADHLSAGSEGLQLKLDQPTENAAITSLALREWIGLLGYRLLGKTADLLPGP